MKKIFEFHLYSIGSYFKKGVFKLITNYIIIIPIFITVSCGVFSEFRSASHWYEGDKLKEEELSKLYIFSFNRHKAANAVLVQLNGKVIELSKKRQNKFFLKPGLQKVVVAASYAEVSQGYYTKYTRKLAEGFKTVCFMTKPLDEVSVSIENAFSFDPSDWDLEIRNKDKEVERIDCENYK